MGLKVFLLAAQLAAATPMGFDDALALAEASESELPAAVTEQLLKVQGDALKSAMTACRGTDRDFSTFTVVFELRSDGSVVQSWRQGETPLAQCVHRELEASGLPGEWTEPFYTFIKVSIEEP